MKKFAFQLGDRIRVGERCTCPEWIGRTGVIVGYHGDEVTRAIGGEGNPWKVCFDDDSENSNYIGLFETSLEPFSYEDKIREALEELEEILPSTKRTPSRSRGFFSARKA